MNLTIKRGLKILVKEKKEFFPSKEEEKKKKRKKIKILFIYV
jgi:hypothetical protein